MENNEKLLRSFQLVTAELEATYHKLTQKMGMSDSAQIILYIICMLGGECLLSDVVHKSSMSKQTVHSSLHKLEREGMLTLRAWDDKKKVVALTPEGKKLAEKTAMRLMRMEQEILDAWPEEDYSTYVRLTERFVEGLKQKMEEI